MKIIETKFFTNQVLALKKKYKLIFEDIDYFKGNIEIEPFSDLGSGVFKYRIGNSSIPVGKRSGFRIIVFIEGKIIVPLLVYSKNIKSNVTKDEIKDALIKVNTELTK